MAAMSTTWSNLPVLLVLALFFTDLNPYEPAALGFTSPKTLTTAYGTYTLYDASVTKSDAETLCAATGSELATFTSNVAFQAMLAAVDADSDVNSAQLWVNPTVIASTAYFGSEAVTGSSWGPLQPDGPCTSTCCYSPGSNHSSAYNNYSSTYNNYSSTYNNHCCTYNNHCCTYNNYSSTYNNHCCTYNNDSNTYNNNSDAYNNDDRAYNNNSNTYNNHCYTYNNHCCAYNYNIANNNYSTVNNNNNNNSITNNSYYSSYNNNNNNSITNNSYHSSYNSHYCPYNSFVMK